MFSHSPCRLHHIYALLVSLAQRAEAETPRAYPPECCMGIALGWYAATYMVLSSGSSIKVTPPQRTGGRVRVRVTVKRGASPLPHSLDARVKRGRLSISLTWRLPGTVPRSYARKYSARASNDWFTREYTGNTQLNNNICSFEAYNKHNQESMHVQVRLRGA